jgi:rhomboid protease GluP
MQEVDQTQQEDIQFLSSAKSQVAKTRGWLWFGVAAGLALSAARGGFGPGLWWSAAVLIVLCGVFDWFFIRPSAQPGRVLIALGRAFIESSRFTTKEKRFAWADIAGVSVEALQGQKMLQLQLRPGPGRPDKRSFLNGINPCRPSFPLAALAPQDQEKLLDAVDQRLTSTALGSRQVDPAVNVLTEERLFQERLVALAPKTWVTYGLIALNVLVWGLTVTLGAGVLQGSAEQLLAWGGNATSEVQQGEWWRLVTATFLHSGILHLAMNMAGLFAMGQMVERIYGHRLFALIYLGAGVLGSAASLHFSAQKVVSVGASGAVFGVAGALLIAVSHHRKQLPRMFGKQMVSGIGFFILYSLAQGLLTPGVDNAAHAGGLLAGLALALILPERFDQAQFARKVKARTVLALIFITVAIVGVVSSAPQAPFDLSESFQSSAALGRGVEKFSEAWKAVEQEMKDVKAGKLSELESDERSRTVHAPRMQLALDELVKAKFSADDPRAVFAADVTRFVRLLHEGLAMESNVVDGKPVPADLVRSAAISAELVELNARLPKELEKMKAAQKR